MSDETFDEMSAAVQAVQKLFDERGSGYEFTADEIWPLMSNVSIKPAAAGSLTTKLKKNGYIVETMQTKRATSKGRKGTTNKGYTFGKALSPDSLEKALARGPTIGGSSSGLPVVDETEVPNTDGQFPLNFPIQRILHGCPGSGKSYRLHEDGRTAHFLIRTVFHPETRYSDFVGGLRPESVYRVGDDEVQFIGAEEDVPGEPYVQYALQSGPLLKAYRLACQYPDHSVVLIVEELSRAVASHVFGDILQLLDRRDGESDPLNGVSEYEIRPKSEIRSWLLLNNVQHAEVSQGNMRFPANFYIWATMNRSDQNARQLDSAFLRRWSKTYLSYREIGAYDGDLVKYGGANVRWGDLRSALNERLKSSEGVPEDKFVGPYFISKRRLADPDTIYEDLWGYIWNDVLKSRAPSFFGGISTFAELRESWASGDGSPIGEVLGPVSSPTA
ncbi:AAA family ATPase [Agrobacterium tumefaciens]